MHFLVPRYTRISRGVVLLTAAVTGALYAALQGQVWAGLALACGAGLYVMLTAVASGAARALARSDSPHHIALTTGDLLIITAVVWLTGGVQSEYYLLYYLPILYAALRLNVRDGIGAAALAAALYLFVAVAGQSGELVITTAAMRVLSVFISAAIVVIFFALLRQELWAYAKLRDYLHDSLRRVSAVYDVAHAASAGGDLGAVLSILLDQAAQATGAERGAIALLESDGRLQAAATFGPGEQVGEPSLDLTSAPARQAIASRASVTVSEARSAGDSSPGGPRSWVHVPLLTPGGAIGLLALATHPGRKFHLGQIEFLETLCSEATTAIENVQLRAQLDRLASTDHLTGLANRREMERCLALETDRANRHDRPLTVLMMDIDNLKDVNDCYGHVVGDRVIVALGRVLGTALRRSDTAGRMGGDEFLVVLPEADATGGAAAAERIRATFRGELQALQSWDAMTASVGLSMGVASRQAGPLSAGQLLSRADDALYQAKRTGKDRSCLAAGAPDLATAGAEQSATTY